MCDSLPPTDRQNVGADRGQIRTLTKMTVTDDRKIGRGQTPAGRYSTEGRRPPLGWRNIPRPESPAITRSSRGRTSSGTGDAQYAAGRQADRMVRGGVAPVLAVLLAGGVLVGCGRTASSAGGPTSTTSPAAHARSIVALGDSVPRGTNCDCTPYPPLTAEAVSGASGQPVTATNDSVAGYTTSAVVRQLDSGRDVVTHVAGADVVEIEVGANDVAHRDSCGTALSCYSAKVPQVKKNLTTIIARLHELT